MATTSSYSSTQKNKRYNEGAPTLEETRQFQETADAAIVSGPIIPNIVAPRVEPNATPEQIKAAFLTENTGKFPIRPLPHDPYDKIWDTKQGLMKSGDVSASRPLPFTEEDILYLQQKAAAEDYATYQTWGAERYDLGDPATRDWYSKVCPSYFEQREQLIDDQIDTMANYAKIRLRGARSEDELKLEYMIETGRVDLPKGPVWDPLQGLLNEAGVKDTDDKTTMDKKIAAYNEKVYIKGIFSPIQAITPMPRENSPQNQMPWAGSEYNLADIRGDPTKKFVSAGWGTLPPDIANIGELYSGPLLGQERRVEKALSKKTPYYSANQDSQRNLMGLPGQKKTDKNQGANAVTVNVPKPKKFFFF